MRHAIVQVYIPAEYDFIGLNRKVKEGTGKYSDKWEYAIFHQFGQEYEEFEACPGNSTIALLELPSTGKIYNSIPSKVRFIDKVPTRLEPILDDCEINGIDMSNFTIYFDGETSLFYAKNFGGTIIHVYELTKPIEKIQEENKHEILEYCLGIKYPTSEIVTPSDIFLHSKFTNKILTNFTPFI